MRNAKYILLLLTVSMIVGCAGEHKTGSAGPLINPGTGPYVPPVVAPGQAPGGMYGGSTPISVLINFKDYTCPPMGLLLDPYGVQGLCYTPNSPQNLRLNLNMVKKADNKWSGTATITYTDNNNPHTGYFTTGPDDRSIQANQVVTVGGRKGWHAVFEDFYLGALVVVIDGLTDLGDGQGTQDLVSGSVWMKNFGATRAPHPPSYCWFVSIGPYDCRPWPAGTGMDTGMSIDPQGGYVKLATFSGLSLKAAFNNQAVF